MTLSTLHATRPTAMCGALVLSLALLACGGEPSGSTPPSGERTAGAEMAAGGPDACPRYARRVCGEAGRQSATCAAMRAAAPMIAPEACAAGMEHFGYTEDKLAQAEESCDTLVEQLCEDLGPETDTCVLVRERTQELSPSDCALMEEHYEEVLADLKRVQRQNRPLTDDELKTVMDEGAPSFGPEDAELVLVAFSDFQCPYCAQAADVTSQIREQYGERVRFVFRQFPLPFHPNADQAAQAALAAHAQDKFWDYHDLLFANQDALDRESLEGYAEQVGLDMDEFNQALDESTYAEQVERDLKLGKQVGVRGTPTMFVGTKRVPNPTDFDMVSDRIEASLGEEGDAQAGDAEAADTQPAETAGSEHGSSKPSEAAASE